jgi:hypothetical protein
VGTSDVKNRRKKKSGATVPLWMPMVLMDDDALVIILIRDVDAGHSVMTTLL